MSAPRPDVTPPQPWTFPVPVEHVRRRVLDRQEGHVDLPRADRLGVEVEGLESFEQHPLRHPGVAALGGGRRRLGRVVDVDGVEEEVVVRGAADLDAAQAAQVRVGDRMHGHGVGRSKKEAEQQAAESAYRTLSHEYGDPTVTTAATATNGRGA